MSKTTTVQQESQVADFVPFAKAVAARFAELSKGELYTTDVGDEIFDKYLAAFPEGTNPVYRTRHLYDCVACKQFIRRMGKLVAIKNGKTVTVWGGLDLPYPFKQVADALDAAVRAAKVTGVFRSKEPQYGVEYNYDKKTNERHDHFHGKVATRHHAAEPGGPIGAKNTAFGLFKRGLTELRMQDFRDVLTLIDANGLYKGAEFRAAVAGFLDLMLSYKAAGEDDLFVWENLDNRYAGFRNTAIGNLLVTLADGMEFAAAVRLYEHTVSAGSYKRTTAPITQSMVDAALKTLNDLDLGGAVHRRYARMSDVSVNDVLFVDNDTRSKMKDGGMAALLAGDVKKSPPDLKKATPIAADDFVANVLPGAKSLDVFVENRHQGNFVALTGADGPERLFKWANNFAWSYDGDVADSVKQRVKAAGGNVNALMRVSLSWFNTDDLDLHCQTPDDQHIYFGNKMGILDVDMNVRGETRNPVENLAFTKLKDGVYVIKVHQYTRRELIDVGFAIEVEFGGQVHQYSYSKSVQPGATVECFKLHVKKGELVKVETALTGGATSQEKWGVKTETLVPAAAVMFSPNYWGDNAVGAKHLIFALKGCRNPGDTRGIYNEFLDSRLERHRKVFEVLGARTKCKFSEDQISGVGFTAARGDSVVVVVDGKRSYNIRF